MILSFSGLASHTMVKSTKSHALLEKLNLDMQTLFLNVAKRLLAQMGITGRLFKNLLEIFSSNPVDTITLFLRLRVRKLNVLLKNKSRQP